MFNPYPTLEDVLGVKPPQRLSVADIMAVATMDPTSSYDHGRLAGLAARSSTDPDDPARDLIEAIGEVPTQSQPAPPYINPARVPHRVDDDRRPLEESDREWLRRLPTDPAAISAADVTTLATMVAEAASAADLRLLMTYFAPVWDHHDLIEQRQAREEASRAARISAGARTRRIEEAAIAALAAAMLETNEGLQPHEVKARAAQQLREAWAAVDAERAAVVEAAAQPPTPRPMPGLEAMSVLAAAESSDRRSERRRGAGQDFLSSLSTT